MTQAGSARLPQLDGLRACAFAGVFLYHATGFPMLWWGVDVFFVLSGFLTTDGLTRGPVRLGAFYRARARRILPAYMVVLVAAAVIWQAPLGGVLRYSPLTANLIVPGELSAFDSALRPLWSLAVEVQFYALWPLVVLAFPRRLWAVAVAACVLAPLVRAGLTMSGGSWWLSYALFPSRMDSFAVGALLALSRRLPAHAICTRTWAAPGLALAVGSVALLAAVRATFHAGANDLLFNTAGYSVLALAAGCVVWLAVTGSTLTRALHHPALVRIGVVSYPLYLVHAGALLLAAQFLGGGTTSVVLAAGASLGIAIVWWRGVELPRLV